jgi:AcrR family transcriptional regulator
MENNTTLFLKTEDYPDVKDTRILLINGLLNLMMTKPLTDITIKELADFSHVGRRTFYRLYERKDDILKDYIRLLVIGYLKTLSPEKKYTVYERLLNAFNWCKANRSIFEVIDNKFLFHTLIEEYDFMINFHTSRFMTRNLLSDFEVETHLERYYDLYNLSGFWHTMTSWVKNGMKESPEEMARLCARMMTV